MAQNNTPTNTPTTTPVAPTATNEAAVNVSESGAAPAHVKGVDMGMIVDANGPNINPAALDASAAIQARTAQVQQNPNFGQGPAISGKTGALNYTALNSGKTEILHKPAAGQTTTVEASAGEKFQVDFDPNAAQLNVRDGDLVFTFNDGAQIVIDHFVMASNQMPSLLLQDGTVLAGGVVVAQLTGKSADDLFNIETAAGPGGGAGGSGGFVYSDDLGGVIDLLNKLPPIPFTQLVFNAPTDRPAPFLLQPDFAPPPVQPTVNDLVDETDGYTNNDRTGQINADFGRDGAGSVTLKPGFTVDGSVAGGTLTSHGSPVTATYAGNTITGTDAAGHVVFTMTVQPDGTYDFKLLGQLDHADTSNPDDLMNLHFTYVVSDKDGDQALGEIIIGVKDDGPVAQPDTNHVTVTVHEFNVIGGAPDFPALQETTNLPVNQPALFQQGAAKASDVVIDHPTTISIDRIQSQSAVSIFKSPVFAYTYDDQGNITNVKLIFADGAGNPSNEGPTHADYTMDQTGHLGFFIARAGTDALQAIGAVDANGNINPNISFNVVANGNGGYKLQYTDANGTHDVMFDQNNVVEPAFAGNFNGQPVYGVAGHQSGDANNVLRYGFEDRTLGPDSDQDYNDVQFKVTVQPTSTDTSAAVHGNVLPNDNVGNDPMPGHSYSTVVTQVTLGNNAFHSFANPTGTDAGGKFITIQGEYGLLKMYENGEYTYQYNTGKKDGDRIDDFKYTIRDQDGDTSTTTLTITVGVNYVPVVSAVGGVIDEAVLLVPGTDTVSNTITINSTDGIGSVKLTTDGLPTLSADGKPVVYTVTPDGKTLTGTAGGEEIFKVELGTPATQPDGSVKVPYTFTLEQPLDNPGDGKNITNIPVKVVVTDTNGDAGNTTIPLQVIDDVPHAVDDSKAMGATSVATGNIITNDTFGADGAAPNGPKVTSITYGAETKTFAGPDSVVTFTTPKGTLEVHADGSYTFTRNPTLGELNETFTYTIKDADGDASTAKLTLTGNDHPVVIVTPDPQDPSAGGNGAPLRESDLLIPGTDSVTKNISFTAPDGVASIVLNKDGLPALSSNGQPVTYTVSQDGKTLTGTADGKPVFTVAIGVPAQQADGSYKAPYVFTLLQPLTNPGTGENVTNIPVKFVVTDTDGDNAAGTLPLQVIDDVPHAVSDAVAMGTAVQVQGNVLLNGDTYGADGVAKGAPALNSVTYGSETKTFAGPDSVVAFSTPSGVISIRADGSYTFDRVASLGNINEVFGYSIKDADGDVSNATLTITGNDNPVTIITPNPQDPSAGGNGAIIPEHQLLVPGTDSVSKDITFTAPDGVASIKLTTDGLPALNALGQPVAYSLSADGKTLVGTANGQQIFTVVLGNASQQANGSYKASYVFTLIKPLDNPGTGENVTNIPVKFVATDTDGDAATGTLPLQVVDDVPHAVDDAKVMGATSVATGNIITNDTFGADGAAPNGPKVTSITYGAETKTFAGPDSVVTFTTPKGILEIHADGSYTFTRSATLGDLNETFNYSIKDADGDISNAKLTLTGNDNPVIIVTPNPQDPSAGGNGAIIQEHQLLVPGTDSVSKDITFTAPDGVASIKLSTDGLPALNALGQPVAYTLSPDGKTLVGTANGQQIFTVVLGNQSQQADGSYKASYVFTLLKPLDNPGTGENVTNIPVKFVATDTDGDSAVGTLPLQVVDDIPHAVDDAKAMGATSVATGNIITNDTFGADGALPNGPKVTSITYGSETKTFAGPDSVVSFTTPKGTLEIHADGSYTFTRNPSLGDLNETFSYSIKDADGDISNAKLTLTGNDNPVVIITPNPQDPSAGGNGAIIQEHQLLVPGTDSVTKEITFTAPDGVASIKLTTDGMPALNALGQPVAYSLSADGKTVTGTANGQTIFTVVLGNSAQQADGSHKASYVFTLLKPLDNPGAGENVTNIPVKFIATDTDGDSAVGTLPLQVVDDVPVANDDVNSVANHGTIGGNIITGAGQSGGADVLSADGPNTLSTISFGGTSKSFANAGDVQTDGNGKFITLNGQYGTLKLYDNGNYTYQHTNGSGALVDKFNYVLSDHDGDSDPASLTINIQNGVPSIPALQGDKFSDETTDINVAITGNVQYTNASSVALGAANGSAQFSASGSMLGGSLHSNGQDVHVALIDGKYVGYTGSDANASGAKVFELTMNGSQYSFKQFSNLDHANGSDPNDVISLKFAVTAKDADGDTATGELKIDVRDDAPVAHPDTNQAVSTTREFNVIGGAPDFPTLQEQKNLPKDRPDLYAQGVAKASNVHIDLPTTVTIERLKSSTEVSIVQSPLFAFTQDANGNISNIQLIFGVGSANPGDNGPMNADYQMTSGGKLGFFIAGGGTNALSMIGAIDANGNVQPGFTYSLKANSHGTYDIQYTHDGQTHTLNFNGQENTPLEARFGGDFLGQDVQGVAGRQDGDANNVLRYGFEDLSKNISDEDYNDVQIKVTINPIIVEVTDPISGNVLPNDVVGQDDIRGLQYGTHLTQVAIGQNAFANFANATGVENGVKFIALQGEYGLLKMFQDGHYTYVYNTDKKDGDMKDDFRYTITDNDGDTSTTSLTIGINLENHTTTASILSSEPAAFAAKSVILSDSGFAPGEYNPGIPGQKGIPGNQLPDDGSLHGSDKHDVDGQLSNDAVSYTLGHQGSDAALVNSLTSNGEAVHTIVVGDVVHGFVGADYDSRTADVFTLTLGQDGHYNFDLQGKIDQASAGTILSFDYTAKETDGSAVEGHIAIGVEGTKVADSTHSDALHLNDVLGSQPTGGDHGADSMNHVASIDIINDILSDDDPHNGYAG